MKRIVFISLVIVMYVGIPLCAYGYYYCVEIQTEEMKTEALIMNANSSFNQDQRSVEEEVADGKSDLLKSERLGFLAAAIALFLIPTLMMVFKGRLIKE